MRDFSPLSSPSERFSRQYALFGLFLFLIVLAEAAVMHWRLCISLLILLPSLFYAEHRVSSGMVEISASSEFHHRYRLSLVPSSCGSILLALVGSRFLTAADFSGVVFTYFFSLAQSALIFLSAAGAKSLLLLTGLIPFKLMRRGFFALFQRSVIGFRNLATIPSWVAHFSGAADLSFWGAITGPKNASVLAYLIVKCFLHLWLLADFGAALRGYRANARPAFVPVREEEVVSDCIVCLDRPVDPVKFNCGHIFCHRCAAKWLLVQPICPLCLAPAVEKQQIEFEDGTTPLAALFFAI
jgi:hypothetical protein